jgi:hypothetical protein
MAGFVMGAVHGIAAGLLLLVALEVFSSFPPLSRALLSLACVALGIYGPTYIAHLGGSSADNITVLFILAAIYLLVRAMRAHTFPGARGSRRALLLGGVLMGIAAGMKLVCVVFLVGYGAAVLVTGRGIRTRLKAAGLFGIAGLAGILVSRGFWMAHLWSRFGSPLFPFYNRIFKSPYYYPKNFADSRYVPKTIGKALLMPFQFITESWFTRLSRDFRDLRYAVVFVLIILCLAALAAWIILRRRALTKHRLPGRMEWFLIVFFTVSYVIWQMKFAILRYAVPLEVIAPVLIVILVRLLLPWNTVRYLVTIGAFAAIVLVMQPWNLMHNEWSSSYIEVEVPHFDEPDKVLVIMPNKAPISYVIPHFQREVRFIGLMNTYSYVGSNRPHEGTKEMLDLVKSHKGPIYFLSSNRQLNEDLQLLLPHNIVLSSDLSSDTKTKTARFRTRDLEERSDQILPVITKHENSEYYLWPLEIYRKGSRRREFIKPDPRSRVKKI